VIVRLSRLPLSLISGKRSDNYVRAVQVVGTRRGGQASRETSFWALLRADTAAVITI